MSVIIISIRREYWEAIASGKKRFEFRKSRPTLGAGKIIFYVSGKGGGYVAGEANVRATITGKPADVWRYSAAGAGINRKQYDGYYSRGGQAVAYCLRNVVAYNKSRPLSDYGIARAPQSWAYVQCLPTPLPPPS